jgi:hypothetical protein
VAVCISTLLSLFRTAEPDDTAASFLGTYPATGSHFFPGALVKAETTAAACMPVLVISVLLSLLRRVEADAAAAAAADARGVEGLAPRFGS